jgi:hypothetical protein
VIVAAITLALSGVVFRSAVLALNVYLRKEPVELRRHLLNVPRTLGSWHAEKDHVLDGATVEALGTDKYLDRTYVNLDDRTAPPISLHIAYYTGMIDAVPHVPDRCFVAGGWSIAMPPENRSLAVTFPEAREDSGRIHGASNEAYRAVDVPHPVTGRPQPVDLPVGDFALRISGYTREGFSGRVLYGGYFFIANHRMTANPEYVRSLAFKPSERYAYFAKVQLAMVLPADEPPDRLVEVSSEFVQQLVPHLMWCLPDWSAVEAGTIASEEPAPSS